MPPSTPAEIHARFVALSGSGQIASEFAIGGLQQLIQQQRPEFVLEVGAGLGTLTATILDATDDRTALIYMEEDDWCRNSLARNVGKHPNPRIAAGWWRRCWRAKDFHLPQYRARDLLVLDGGSAELPPEYLNLDHRARIFVEGNRRQHRQSLEAQLDRGHRSWCRVQQKPYDRTKGFFLYQLDPTLGERLWYLAIRLREWFLDWPARLSGRPVGKRRR